MAVTFNHLSWLPWRGRQKQSNSSSSDATQEPGFWELDALQFPIANGNNIASSSSRVERKWSSREERRLDKENDVVVVPHDGGCISGSGSQDSDWSVGWLEPHGPEFLRGDNDDDDDNESDSSFAVLVPCYGLGMHNSADGPQIKLFDPTGNFSDALLRESTKYLEQWLSSLHNN